MGYRNDLRSLGSEARLSLAGWFLFQFSFFGVWYTLFNLYLLRLGYTARLIGIVNAGAFLAFALMCVPAGLLGARYGSRKIMIVGLLLCLAFRALLLAGPVRHSGIGTAWLLTTYFCSALGSALYMVSFVPALSAFTETQTRGIAFSVSVAATGLGTFSGRLVGGLIPVAISRFSRTELTSPGPYRLALLLAPLLMLGSVALVAFARETTVETKSSSEHSAPSAARPWSLIIAISLVWFVFQAARGPVFSFFNVYLDSGIGVPVSIIGIVMAVASLVSVPAVLAAPMMANRVGRILLIRVSMLAVAGGCLLLSIQTLWTAALSYVVITAALGVAEATYIPFSQDAVGQPDRAVMSGFITHATALAWAIMTFGGGIVIEAVSFKTLFMVAAAIPVLSVVLYSLSSFGRGRSSPRHTSTSSGRTCSL